MSFESAERIAAVLPQDVPTIFPELLAQYGEALPDGPREIITIGAHRDDTARARMRAASLADGTIAPIPLTDGRVAFRCLWQTDLAAALEAGQIAGVEELTEEEFSELQPTNEE